MATKVNLIVDQETIREAIELGIDETLAKELETFINDTKCTEFVIRKVNN